MVWNYRPDQDPQAQLLDIEKSLGVSNLRDVSIDETNGFLYVFTETKKFRITMTDVS